MSDREIDAALYWKNRAEAAEKRVAKLEAENERLKFACSEDEYALAAHVLELEHVLTAARKDIAGAGELTGPIYHREIRKAVKAYDEWRKKND